MSVFRNIATSQCYITGFLRYGDGTVGPGASVVLEKDEEFSGSNYFKRFTYSGMISAGLDATTAANEAFLALVTDDGVPFDLAAGNTPNNPIVYNSTIAVGNDELFDFTTDLGGPALFTTIEVNDEDVYVYLNDSATARVTVTAGTTLSFANGELLLSSIRIGNTISGASSSAVVQIISANSI
jgi:hypothetical protein